MEKSEVSKELFLSGCNCSQAVAGAFADEMNMDADTVKRLTIGFGGGMSRMREVCGAVSAMTFVISAIYNEDRGSIYKRVQEVAGKFREQNGSIICRELLGLDIKGADSPIPEKRTQQYYKERPCIQLIMIASAILEEYLKTHKI